jgi:hypothetical protein
MYELYHEGSVFVKTEVSKVVEKKTSSPLLMFVAVFVFTH